MTELKEIVQGNTGTLYKVGVVGDPDLSAGGPDYTCNISIPSAIPPITRAVTVLVDTNTRFAVQLTPAETLLLAACDKHKMAIEVQNTTLTPIFNVETSVEFYVKEQVIL
jgi:hypothetical protein